MAATKTAILIENMYVPVRLHGATRDTKIHFNQLHVDDHQRIQERKICSHCQKELKSEDIVRGFDTGDGNYVVVTDQELDKLKTRKDRAIKIEQTLSLDQISPIFYEKSYHLTPEPMGEKVFEVLRRGLMNKQLAALGTVVLGTSNSETMILLIPREDGILAQTLRYAEEVKEFPSSYSRPEPNERELELTEKLIELMQEPFDPTKFQNDYQHRLRDFIEAKRNNQEVVTPDSEPVEGGNVISLMELLTQSVKQRESQEKEKKKSTRKPKRVKGA